MLICSTYFSSISRKLLFCSRRKFSSKCRNSVMGSENLRLIDKRQRAGFRLCNVSGCKIDVMEIHATDPKFHVLFIPGNPGVISFYVDFLESLYYQLEGTASVTAISHIAQTEKNWENGRLFSLQEQTDHKINFIEHELQDVEVPIVLVGHSIGSYISLDIFKRFQEKVTYCICLYPFLAVNTKSSTQTIIKKIAASRILCTGVSSIVAVLGLLPAWISRILVKNSVGNSWCPSAVEALCTHVLRYHTVQNMLYMAMTEFEKLSEVPDWSFMREKKSQMAFLFGVDDHWGPLDLYEEISIKVPGAVLAVERGGYTHAFSCTEAGSTWVAQHVSGSIKNYFS
ncbi:lipid droplet-associated hydrolase isoform X1 [Capsicum annuum]|nr:lipid droplet-associated hydrolase isoform X1 [Capsicum annuum]